jgi:MYXO-CTERM domain-containing protein
MPPRVLALTAALALAAAEARGQQGGWAFEVEYMPGSGGVVSPAFPEATVRLLAWFDPPQVLVGGEADVVASDGLWADVRLLEIGDPPRPQPPGTTPGTIEGNAVRGILAGQVAICGTVGCPRPLPRWPLWEGTWRVEDFRPRSVDLITENTDRFAYFDPATQKSVPLTATPGSGQVRVVPSPGPAGLLVLAGLPALQRRGRRWTEVSS